MNNTTTEFFYLFNGEHSFRIRCTGQLSGAMATHIRQLINATAKSESRQVQIDVKDITDADLSGINEIIHAHFTLSQAGKELLFIYKKDSAVEKWVNRTGLSGFINTAIIPAQ